MSPAREDALGWVETGTALVSKAIRGFGPEADFEAPSLLPGWTRKHVLAHLAANGVAVGNLVTWARTGVETPMYVSREQRNADIEAGAGRGAPDLIESFDDSADALGAGWASLTPEQWDAPVVTAQGRTVPASETPWMRAREVMVHAVDLGGPVTFDDLPEDFLVALGDDIAAKRAGQGTALELAEGADGPARWRVGGDGPVAQRVVGPLPQLVAYLAGRPHTGLSDGTGGPAPELAPWL